MGFVHGKFGRRPARVPDPGFPAADQFLLHRGKVYGVLSLPPMSRPATNPNDQASSLRNLQLLVVVLVVSNILLGLMSVYLLRSVDQRYSELVGRTVPALNDLRELMSRAVEAMRATNPKNFEGPNQRGADALLNARRRLDAAQNFRGITLKDGYFSAESDLAVAILRTGQDFDLAGAAVARLYDEGRLTEVARRRDEKLLPAFDSYVAAIGAAADAVESRSLAASKDYSAKTDRLSTVVLSVASWPVLIVLALLLLTAVFVLAMMIAFRGKDLPDSP